MSRQQITSMDGSPAVLLPPAALDSLGVAVGDEVELDFVDGKVILQSLGEWERQQKLLAITTELLQTRRSAYERLAEGAG